MIISRSRSHVTACCLGSGRLCAFRLSCQMRSAFVCPNTTSLPSSLLLCHPSACLCDVVATLSPISHVRAANVTVTGSIAICFRWFPFPFPTSQPDSPSPPCLPVPVVYLGTWVWVWVWIRFWLRHWIIHKWIPLVLAIGARALKQQRSSSAAKLSAGCELIIKIPWTGRCKLWAWRTLSQHNWLGFIKFWFNHLYNPSTSYNNNNNSSGN